MPSQYETLAREALLEITPAATIGALASESTDDDGVITVRFFSVLGGYPGWQWNVSLSHVDGYDPTVIEAELLPDNGALLAPDWVPWSERLAEYKAAQEAAGLDAEQAGVDGLDAEAAAQDDEGDVDDEDLDDDEDDDMDDVSLSGSNLHSGDLDGVDIDELAEAADDDAAGAVGPENEDSADEASANEDSEDEDSEDEAEEIADEVAEYGATDTEDDEGL